MSRLLIVLASLTGYIGAQEHFAFPQAFIRTYDITKRDTHEYTTYTLEKTRKSFLELESALRNEGFCVAGRLGILGYQEEAFRPYTTDWERHALEDEAVVKTQAGIAQPTKNIFGFITGFLLKDAEWLQRSWAPAQEPQITHICGRPIDLFSDHAVLFQKHSFGKDYDTIIAMRDKIERVLYSRNTKSVLAELVTFWQGLLERSSKTGSHETVGTQDMLFSISYAQALLDGQAPINKLFVGPDITYPIEVLSCQKSQATVHAQQFIKQLHTELVPVNNESTAYIFCSFVDGVGKSTLLNNIRNWGVYADKFEQYQRCDNSSSQEATLFTLKDNVHIVDLPAQLSHFVIKPDGQVFVDIATVKDIPGSVKAQVLNYIKSHKAELVTKFLALVTEYKQHMVPLYTQDDPVAQYAQACALMIPEGTEIPWIAYSTGNYCFLFNKQKPDQLRVLVPLAHAHSTGLKAVNPEQMLFNKGLSLPMRYSVFVRNLLDKLQSAQVKQVVFVDFLSMYPRSSRETIRLNFVLQYLKRIYMQEYNFEHSFYQHRVHKAQETAHVLRNYLDDAVHTVVLETVLRWALDLILEDTPSQTVSALTALELEDQLIQRTKKLLEQHKNRLYQEAYRKLETEQQQYIHNYRYDRIYQTLVQFSMGPVLAFNQFMQQLFTHQVSDEYFASLWSGLERNFVTPPVAVARVPVQMQLDGAISIDIMHRIPSACREEGLLRDFVRRVRAQWFAALANLLTSSSTDAAESAAGVAKVAYPVPGLYLKATADGLVYAVQKSLPMVDTRQIRLQPPALFNLSERNGQSRRWGVVDRTPHCLDWHNDGTYYGVFAYGYDPKAKQKNTVTRIVEKYKQLATLAGKPETGIAASELWAQLSTPEEREKLKTEYRSKKIKLLEPNDPQIPTLRLWVRAVATLDMVLKDVDSRILIAQDTKADFAATLQLLEQLTLPLYFNRACKERLFSDYSCVEPVIPWSVINNT